MNQSRSGDTKFFQAFGDCTFQHSFALLRQSHEYVTLGVSESSALYERVAFCSIHEFHGTVVPDMQLFCQRADCRLSSVRKSLNGEQKLILPLLNPSSSGCAIAEIQILPDVIPNLGQCLVLFVGDR